MAYIIGNKILKDSDPTLQHVAYGITLPVRRGSNGFFAQAFTSYDQAKSNIANLLSTKKGERVMQPEFGSGLQSVLFEPMGGDFEKLLEDTITESVGFWLPYINVDQIDVSMTDEMKDKNTAEISITFSVGNQIETDMVTFTIQG